MPMRYQPARKSLSVSLILVLVLFSPLFVRKTCVQGVPEQRLPCSSVIAAL